MFIEPWLNAKNQRVKSQSWEKGVTDRRTDRRTFDFIGLFGSVGEGGRGSKKSPKKSLVYDLFYVWDDCRGNIEPQCLGISSLSKVMETNGTFPTIIIIIIIVVVVINNSFFVGIIKHFKILQIVFRSKKLIKANS